MSKTVTGTYDSADKALNAVDDLISTGIPQEMLYHDEQTNQVKVIIPASTEAEIVEILKRHDPTQVTSS